MESSNINGKHKRFFFLVLLLSANLFIGADPVAQLKCSAKVVYLFASLRLLWLLWFALNQAAVVR